MSQELYDSDNPDCPLNAYHIESKPRLIALEDINEQGKQVLWSLNCQKVTDDTVVNHKDYQNYYSNEDGAPTKVFTNNLITQDFIVGTQQQLTCAICQSTLTNPVQFRLCVHRFCSHCIEAYNRQGKKECPVCRVEISNRRHLRPDKLVEKMIGRLSTSMKRIEKQLENENEEVRRKMLLQQKKLKEKADKQKDKGKDQSSDTRKKAAAP